MKSDDVKEEKLMRVGELAKAVGKTVRAMHLYEELGLLDPDGRSEGGFRLYNASAVERIQWITKLQAIGFTLAEIQGFVREFREANSGREASNRARDVFTAKVTSIREQIAQLQMIENDLLEAVAYLDSCQTCATHRAPSECGSCNHEGHHPGEAPRLFAGLSSTAGTAKAEPRREFDVSVKGLFREGNN